MAKEILAIPEESLPEVIRVIRAGLTYFRLPSKNVSDETKDRLIDWCDKMEIE